LNVLGFQSHRDHFAIGLNRSAIESRAKDMISTALTDEQLGEKYNIKSSGDWKIREARKSIRQNTNWADKILRCSYRLFDDPYCYFGYEFMNRPRRELLDNVAGRDNLSLVVSRQIGTANWRHAFVATGPANDCLISDQSSEANQVFPLWRFDQKDGSKRENFSSKFRAFIDSKYDHHFTPEDVLGYIYAILYAPTYRTQSAEFLRIDFPRIPFPENSEVFEALSRLGWALIQAHTLRGMPDQQTPKYNGKGDHKVEVIRYSPEEQRLWINETQYFAPIPEAVWVFRIGGYQVIDKYLNSRKDRSLSLDEIKRISAIAASLAFTISQMASIDTAYKAAFAERG